MKNNQQLLAAVRAQPNEDMPRLVYADWLEEQEEFDRAELIRVSCELANVNPRGTRATQLRKAQNHLWERNAQTWLKRVPNGVSVTQQMFARGFVTALHNISVRSWLNHSALLLEILPALHQLHLHVDQHRVDDETMQALFRCRELEFITDLDLNSCYVSDKGAQALADSPYVKNLRSLRLIHNHVGVNGVTSLANSANLHDLRSLDLSITWTNDDALNALANSKSLANLGRLDLSANQISSAGVATLATSPLLKKITSLGVGHIADAGAMELAKSPHLENLTELNLSGNGAADFVTESGLAAILNMESLGSLRTLYLNHNQISTSGIEMLANTPKLSELRALDLNWNPGVGDDALTALANSPYMTNLQTLSMMGGRSHIANVGATAFANSKQLANLIKVDFRYNEIGDSGAQAIAESPHLQNIRMLNLKNNAIYGSVVKQLKQRFKQRVKV